MTVVLDTSAVIAVVLGEEDATIFADAIAANVGELHISAATIVECMIVAEARHGSGGLHEVEVLLRRAAVVTVPFDASQATHAAAAWRRFGKGRHAASLNLGDCYSYALARHLGASLLFKGRDFAQTDVTSVF